MLTDRDKALLLRAALIDAVDTIKAVEERFENAACAKLDGKRVPWCNVAGLMAQDVTGKGAYWVALIASTGTAANAHS